MTTAPDVLTVAVAAVRHLHRHHADAFGLNDTVSVSALTVDWYIGHGRVSLNIRPELTHSVGYDTLIGTVS